MGNSRTPTNDPAPTYLPPPWALRMQAEADRAEARLRQLDTERHTA